MSKNSKMLKVSSVFFVGILSMTSLSNVSILAKNIELKQILPNNNEISVNIEEESGNKAKVTLIAKQNVENVALRLSVNQNSNFTYKYDKLSKNEMVTFEIDLSLEENSKKLPLTSSVKKQEKINTTIYGKNISGIISYYISEEQVLKIVDNKDNLEKHNLREKEVNNQYEIEKDKKENIQDTEGTNNKYDISREKSEVTIKVLKDNLPFSDVELSIIKWDNNIPNIERRVKTSSSGEIKLENLEENKNYEVRISANNYRFNKEYITFSTDDKGNVNSGTNNFVFSVSDSTSTNISRVEFTVLDKETGKPMSGVEFTANTLYPRLKSYKNAISDENGKVVFDLEGEINGKEYSICVSKEAQFFYEFDPKEITVIVEDNHVRYLSNSHIFNVTKNDKIYLKNLLNQKIKEAETIINNERSSEVNELKKIVTAAKEELTKETIPPYVVSFIEKIDEKINILNNPIIRHIDTENLILEQGEAEATIKIFGKNLNKNIKIDVLEEIEGENIPSNDIALEKVTGEKSGVKTLHLNIKENNTDKDKIYLIKYGYSDNNYVTRVIVKPNKEKIEDVKIPMIIATHNNKVVLDNLIFEVFEKENPKDKREYKLELSMLSNIEVYRDKIYLLRLKENNKYKMKDIQFNVNSEGVPININNGEILSELKIDNKDVSNNSSRIADYKIDKTIIDSSGGTVSVEIIGDNLEAGVNKTRIKVVDIDNSKEELDITNNIQYIKDEGKLIANIKFPENSDNKTKSYSLVFYSKLNQTFFKEGTRAQKDVISILPNDKKLTDSTISNISITSYTTSVDGLANEKHNNKHTVTSTNQESKKTEVRIYGTNLREDLTKIRIFDENGVEWPIFTSGSNLEGSYPNMSLPGTAGVGNGIVGNGNFQILEVILPNNLDRDMTYTYYVSVDGNDNINEEHKVTATVLSGTATSSKEVAEKRSITVKYQDENGNSLKDDKILTGYSWFDYNIIKENIENYKFKESYSNISLNGKFGNDDKVIKLIYTNSLEDRATLIEKEELIKAKSISPSNIENFRESDIEYQIEYSKIREEIIKLLDKQELTKQEISNVLDRLKVVKDNISLSGAKNIAINKLSNIENSNSYLERIKEANNKREISSILDEIENVLSNVEKISPEDKKMLLSLATSPKKIENYNLADKDIREEYEYARNEILNLIRNDDITKQDFITVKNKLISIKDRLQKSIDKNILF